ncbi:hypothetical protein B9T31_09565 [Acinetobacter sp. ANC 4558]|uniref:hypothetical protein n=1 Tax=Acinetobacter sp. ANC 4558 TaxID=1977876 RepID=UPI000A35B49B|nr:hypothetical protein [Acinetobacter sp. ANC 4558]OTG85833.1 hypothetical protein B9T31_09565 [Acinetobacter sp. ANC 4558]
MSSKWFDIEKGAVAQEFKSFVDSWNEQNTSIKCLFHERTGRSVIFDMSADDVVFSFRRVGEKFSLLFNGKYEFIQKETFMFFENICVQYLKDCSGG